MMLKETFHHCLELLFYVVSAEQAYMHLCTVSLKVLTLSAFFHLQRRIFGVKPHFKMYEDAHHYIDKHAVLVLNGMFICMKMPFDAKNPSQTFG